MFPLIRRFGILTSLRSKTASNVFTRFYKGQLPMNNFQIIQTSGPWDVGVTVRWSAAFSRWCDAHPEASSSCSKGLGAGWGTGTATTGWMEVFVKESFKAHLLFYMYNHLYLCHVSIVSGVTVTVGGLKGMKDRPVHNLRMGWLEAHVLLTRGQLEKDWTWDGFGSATSTCSTQYQHAILKTNWT